jgi:hypothetical protein
MPNFIKRLIASNREFILNEVVEVKGLMQLLMKHKNTGQEWTLLPLLAEVLERRKERRI